MNRLFYDWLYLSQYQLFSPVSSLPCCRLIRILYICILASCQYPSQETCLHHSMHISWLANTIRMKDYFFALVFLAFDNIDIFLFLFPMLFDDSTVYVVRLFRTMRFSILYMSECYSSMQIIHKWVAIMPTLQVTSIIIVIKRNSGFGQN